MPVAGSKPLPRCPGEDHLTASADGCGPFLPVHGGGGLAQPVEGAPPTSTSSPAALRRRGSDRWSGARIFWPMRMSLILSASKGEVGGALHVYQEVQRSLPAWCHPGLESGSSLRCRRAHGMAWDPRMAPACAGVTPRVGRQASAPSIKSAGGDAPLESLGSRQLWRSLGPLGQSD